MSRHRITTLITESGSTYRVTEGPGNRWWLACANVPNPHSVQIDPQALYEIEEPENWPPTLGSQVLLNAHPRFALDDPRRIPGGGKFTSPVAEIVTVDRP